MCERETSGCAKCCRVGINWREKRMRQPKTLVTASSLLLFGSIGFLRLHANSQPHSCLLLSPLCLIIPPHNLPLSLSIALLHARCLVYTCSAGFGYAFVWFSGLSLRACPAVKQGRNLNRYQLIMILLHANSDFCHIKISGLGYIG